MPHHIRTITLLAGLALLVAACGGDDTPSTTTQAAAPPTTQAATTTTTAGATTTETPVATTAATELTTTTTAEASGITPGDDADVDAVVDVYGVVFDSSTSFDDKAQYIDDPSGLEDTVATYGSTGDSVGGVTAEPTAVTVNGEDADVVYTLLFSGNPTYPDLSGTAVLTDEGWKVTRDMFCGVMASARSACPAG